MGIQSLKINNANNIAKEKDYGIKPFSKKRLNLISLFILSTLSLLALGFFIYPAAVKAQQLRVNLSRIEQELEQKLKLEGALQELIGKYRNDLKLAEGVVFTDRDIATFLENFSDFARQANMTPVSIKSLKIRPVPTYTESEKALQEMKKKKDNPEKKMEEELPGLLMQPMRIEIKGGYPDLINFLISLEGYKQLITVNDLNIGVAREGYPLLEASFIIRLYTIESPEGRDNQEV